MRLDQPTHFERAMNVTLSYDREAQSFAKEAVKENFAKKLAEFLLGKKAKIPLDRMSPTQVAQALQPLSSRVLSYAHHITQELLRRQENQYSFVELTKNPELGALYAVSTATNDEFVINVSGHMHYQMAAHRLAGRKVYSPSSGLAEQLAHTELRGLTVDDLKLPHPSIYITVPEESGLQIWNQDSGWHKVIGIYITEETGRETRSWRFLVCGEPKPIEVVPGVFDDNDALIYFQVPLPKGMALTEALALTQEGHTQDVERCKALQAQDPFGPMLEKWQTIFHWAMNVVLYVSLEDSEVREEIANREAKRVLDKLQGLPKNSKKRKNLRSKLSGLQQQRRIVLGEHVTAQRGGWQLTVRVRVRGHWRNQPYGPERMYRRLQWIEPYWKGSDDGTVENKAT